MRVAAVIPAAGEGSRLGGPKAVARLAGEPMVARVAQGALRVAAEVVVVLGAGAPEAARLVPAPARALVHDGWRSGRTGSLKAGLAALAPADAFLVWPVDVPLATGEDAAALVAASVPGRAAVLAHGGRRGHPVLLPWSLRDAVLALGDDAPLHDVVRAADPVVVETGNPGVVLDIDTPDDLRRAEELLARAAGRAAP